MDPFLALFCYGSFPICERLRLTLLLPGLDLGGSEVSKPRRGFSFGFEMVKECVAVLIGSYKKNGAHVRTTFLFIWCLSLLHRITITLKISVIMGG